MIVCVDDMLIKLWDWDKKWSCSQVFEGHTHYVMQIVINPKDNNQFASASLDRTIKVRTDLLCCNQFFMLFKVMWPSFSCINAVTFTLGLTHHYYTI